MTARWPCQYCDRRGLLDPFNLMPDMPLGAGAVLLIGCLGALFANVMKAAQLKSGEMPMKEG